MTAMAANLSHECQETLTEATTGQGHDITRCWSGLAEGAIASTN